MGTCKQECKQTSRAKTPLDPARLRDLALSYVARYAISAARLERYLKRKIREQGWADEAAQDGVDAHVALLVESCARLGYVDDAGFAKGRQDSLLRRGYGARRITETLARDGIGASLRAHLAPGEGQLRQAALALAMRRRLGPFAVEKPDRQQREKHVAALMRAGHSLDFARKIVDAPSAQEVQEWAHELDDDENRQTLRHGS